MSIQETQVLISPDTEDTVSSQKPTIRQLNDAFRQTLIGGKVIVTRGVALFGAPAAIEIMDKVSNCAEFTAGNDPYEEHDFGVVIHDDQKLFWKIDYYDKSMMHGSPDPADPAVTTRVLTVMLACEY